VPAEQGLARVARGLQTVKQGALTRPDKNDEAMGDEGTMDAMKVTGVLIAVVLAGCVVKAAPEGALAWIDVALVGLLYVVRQRRLNVEVLRHVR
jgi:hypothetical protein